MLQFLRKRWRAIILVLGLAVIAFFVDQAGPMRVVHVLKRLGWWIPLLLFVPPAVQHAGFIVGWWLSFPPKKRPPIASLILPHIAGEAANVVTGAAEIGGEPVRVALVAPRDGVANAGASALEARTLRIIAQVLFVGAGTVVGIVTRRLPRLVEISLLIGVPLLAIGVALFVRLQMRHLLARTVERVQHIAARVHIHIPDRARDEAAKIDKQVAQSYEHRTTTAVLSTLVQLAAWALLGSDPWIVANVLGRRMSFADGVLVESLTIGMSTVFFIVPSGLGIVDLSRLLLFRAFGIGAAIGVTWTIVRRIQELTWATMGLIILRMLKRRDGAPPHR